MENYVEPYSRTFDKDLPSEFKSILNPTDISDFYNLSKHMHRLNRGYLNWGYINKPSNKMKMKSLSKEWSKQINII